jgi:hypothetical protein
MALRPDPRALALRIEKAQAEQLDRTPTPSRAGRPSLLLAGGRAVFMGQRSPYSLALGIGLGGSVAPADIDSIESLLGDRGGAVRIEINPFCDPSLSVELGRRGYRAEQFLLVWWRPLDGKSPPPEQTAAVRSRIIRPEEDRLWSRVFFHAYLDRPPRTDEELQGGLSIVHTSGNACFVAERGQTVVGVGAVSAHDGVGLLSGDGVLPDFRGASAQVSLIQTRVAWAAAQGCALVSAATEPMTASQRNYEKAGFRLAYPKLVMVKEPTRQ